MLPHGVGVAGGDEALGGEAESGCGGKERERTGRGRCIITSPDLYYVPWWMWARM